MKSVFYRKIYVINTRTHTLYIQQYKLTSLIEYCVLPCRNILFIVEIQGENLCFELNLFEILQLQNVRCYWRIISREIKEPRLRVQVVTDTDYSEIVYWCRWLDRFYLLRRDLNPNCTTSCTKLQRLDLFSTQLPVLLFHLSFINVCLASWDLYNNKGL